MIKMRIKLFFREDRPDINLSEIWIYRVFEMREDSIEFGCDIFDPNQIENFLTELDEKTKMYKNTP